METMLYSSDVPNGTRDSGFSGSICAEIDTDLGCISLVLGTQQKNGRGDDVTHIYIRDKTSFPHCVEGPTVVLDGHHPFPAEALETIYWEHMMALATAKVLVQYIKSVDDAAFKAGHARAKQDIREVLGIE